MDFVSKYLLRGAGFLVAAQIFLTFALTSDDLVEKLIQASKFALFPIPLFVVGAFLTTENGLRAVGFTILLWAGAGATLFFGSVYGDPEMEQVLPIRIPQPHELSLGFGITNFACVLLLGTGVWLWGLKKEPPAKTYHDIG